MGRYVYNPRIYPGGLRNTNMAVVPKGRYWRFSDDSYAPSELRNSRIDLDINE